MSFILRLTVLLLAVCAFAQESVAKTRRGPNEARSAERLAEMQLRERINAGTVGLAGGLLEGAPIRFATEIARIVNDGSETHVLPIVTRGPTENVNDLLYLRGVDAAIINSDSLEEYKSQVPQIQERITYILSLFPSELHVFVRPEIKSLADLAGKKVNFNTQGTAAAYTGPLVFSRLGVDVEKMFIPHPVALEQLRRGEIAAVVFVTSKPVDAFAKGKWDEGFKFLPIEFGSKFEDYYIASTLDSADYPSLIASGERIPTIAVPTILASFNWHRDTQRYPRIARFVDDLFGRMDKLRSPGFDPRWKDVDLSSRVPGLERFQAAQDWLDRATASKQSARP
jgi:TRAP-type uncharacterized transport system substrate-binding protein